jgi:hypothetical protein
VSRRKTHEERAEQETIPNLEGELAANGAAILGFVAIGMLYALLPTRVSFGLYWNSVNSNVNLVSRRFGELKSAYQDQFSAALASSRGNVYNGNE